MRHQIFIFADDGPWQQTAIRTALVSHYPDYVADNSCRTIISVLAQRLSEVQAFTAEHRQLMDHSYWSVSGLRGDKLLVHQPHYHGLRDDFVDIEWDFVIGEPRDPALAEMLAALASDPSRQLSLSIAYSHPSASRELAALLSPRLPQSVKIETVDPEPQAEDQTRLTEMAKYLNYFYHASYEQRQVPDIIPYDQVQRLWDSITDERLRMSNIYSVMTIPTRMEILGIDRSRWNELSSLSAEQIDVLTPVEHNRWSVERLIQGMRPCTGQERREIEEDMRRRLSDPEYAHTHPVSLRVMYETERNAHYDLCSFAELGVDQTGHSVVRYDRDLLAAIPLIIKAYNDRCQQIKNLDT